MQRTRIKICGITNASDGLLAAEAGADAIGMVFYKPAPRCISSETAREILSVLPPFVTPVGLFVDAPAAEIKEAVGSLGLRHVQLHGHESAEVVGELRGCAVLKAVRIAASSAATELEKWKTAIAAGQLHHLRGFVLETAGKGVGGTGVENDWAEILKLQQAGAFAGLPPIIAAGGLRPENVGAVVRSVRPYAVDVSSGVEGSPGRKSAEKLATFVREVREADASINRVV